MKLYVEWSAPIPLRRATRENLAYGVDLDRLPTTAGVYILGRRFGHGFEALYVGKAMRIRGRLKQQLNNLRLMQHMKNAKAGSRVILAGTVITKPGQRLERVLPLVERALIRYYLSEGHDLVNIQGTHLRRHEIISSGKHPKRFIPGLMYLERSRRE